jgi:hypothetical protein
MPPRLQRRPALRAPAASREEQRDTRGRAKAAGRHQRECRTPGPGSREAHAVDPIGRARPWSDTIAAPQLTRGPVTGAAVAGLLLLHRRDEGARVAFEEGGDLAAVLDVDADELDELLERVDGFRRVA